MAILQLRHAELHRHRGYRRAIRLPAFGRAPFMIEGRASDGVRACSPPPALRRLGGQLVPAAPTQPVGTPRRFES